MNEDSDVENVKKSGEKICPRCGSIDTHRNRSLDWGYVGLLCVVGLLTHLANATFDDMLYVTFFAWALYVLLPKRITCRDCDLTWTDKK